MFFSCEEKKGNPPKNRSNER
jgi:hypothetical protein